MKVAILGDTHFGKKSNSMVMTNYFNDFFRDIFFPELESRGIKHLIHMGDLVDRREELQFHTWDASVNRFFERVSDMGIETHILVGNHDCFYRNRVDLNAVHLLLKHSTFKNIHAHTTPRAIDLGGTEFLMLPWIAETNAMSCLNAVNSSTAKVCCGHLELQGFQDSVAHMNESGLSPDIFKRFPMVLSGHFHIKQMVKNIMYVGTPYEMDMGDSGASKGFHILDTDTLQMEWIRNPRKMFYRLVYSDIENTPIKVDLDDLQGKFVELHVASCKDPIGLDDLISQINSRKPHDFKIIESASANLSPTTLDMDTIQAEAINLLEQEIEQISYFKHKERTIQLARDIWAVTQGVNS
jgi:DNA repair exonuclease SbcCD nuclease subunit